MLGLIEIFRKIIPSCSYTKKDKKRIRYCQRCGRWLTHKLVTDEFDKIRGEIIKKEKEDVSINIWKNKQEVKFYLCDSCLLDVENNQTNKTDIDKMTKAEFNKIYFTTNEKIYDYTKKRNKKIK